MKQTDITEPGINILALDAADHRLVDAWDCQHIQLDQHAPLATFGSGRHDGWPLTLDVWPAIAHGHRISETSDAAVTQEWETPALAAASRAAQWLPQPVLDALGRGLQHAGFQLGMTDTGIDDHLFAAAGRAADNWPGITDTTRLEEMWRVCGAARSGDLTHRDLRETLVDDLHAALDALTRQQERGSVLAGSHTHILDVAGHIYADDPSRLREYYQLVNDAVGRVREQHDRLVIISDHGMQVDWLDDPKPAEHSFSALVSQQGLSALPDTVVDVRDWIDPQVPAVTDDAAVDAAVSREQLAALGYVDMARRGTREKPAPKEEFDSE